MTIGLEWSPETNRPYWSSVCVPQSWRGTVALSGQAQVRFYGVPLAGESGICHCTGTPSPYAMLKSRFRTTLTELNPFIQRTDPCLYSWKNGCDFDCGLRYREARYLPRAVRAGRHQVIDDPWQLPS